MPRQLYTNLDSPGGDSADTLARRLGEVVNGLTFVSGPGTSDGNGKGNGNGEGNGNGAGHVTGSSPVDRARETAAEVGVAMLAAASVGTAEHSNDVVLIADAIGEVLGLSTEEVPDLRAAARLHDIGKVCVPKEILDKPGALSDDEWAIMREHTLLGEQILSSVEELGGVARLVRHSHERWDGEGYPDGLAGEEIPLGSRIIFCADAFHAIRCDRPYRAGNSAKEAIAEITRCGGTQFDPRVVEAMEEIVRRPTPSAQGGRPPRSARLMALLMVLVVGGAGSALARSDVLGQAPVSHAPASVSSAPSACGPACPSVAGSPFGTTTSLGAPIVPPGLRLAGGNPAVPFHGKAGPPGSASHRAGPHGKSGAAHGKGHQGHGKAKGRNGQSNGRSTEAHAAAGPASSSHSSGGSGGHQPSAHSGSSHGSGGHRSGGHRSGGRPQSRGAAGEHGNAGGSSGAHGH